MVLSDLGTIVALKHCTTSAIEAAKLGATSVAASCLGTLRRNLGKRALGGLMGGRCGAKHWRGDAVYVAISLVMVAVKFGDRLVLNFVPRRNRRR